MKKHMMIAAALAALAAPSMALAADVSGVWVRNAQISDPRPDAMYWLVRVPPPTVSTAEFVLTVKQEGEAITIANPNLRTRTIRLDGRPATVPADTLIQNATVTGVNQPDAVVITTEQPYGGMPGNARLTVKETWTLSASGKTLTVRTERKSPARTQIDTQVYSRRS
jgi:hypothetical protein